EWDSVNKRVLPAHRQWELLNKQIDDLLDRLDISYKIVSKGGREPVTAGVILACYRNVFEPPKEKHEETGKLFLDILGFWINNREYQLEKQEIRYSTFKKNREAITKAVSYLEETGKQRVKASEFSIRSAHRYRAWLEDQGYGYAHINKLLKTIRQAVKWAYEHEYIETNTLDGLKLKRDTLPIPAFLTIRQVRDLATKPFQSPVLQRVADLMFVYCRTGFHYTDLKLVIESAQEEIGEGLAGFDWINHARIKTGVFAKVPIFDDLKPIVEKYGGWSKLPLISNDKMNYFLKVIAAERGLNPKLSVKFGRNSFADWLLNEKGWSIPAVKVVLGLRTDAMVNRYVRADERRVALELKKRKTK
ncbi:MAG: phage integrase SAM-like domain-containing protein, partial [Siphonobacter aquaeclarae]|nr:phage integrase SAM-like domain-containing protein [Siphonobacter aquaeclarae]